MIDTRALAQEVQDQLLEAVHRGQQQFRKGQDQLRKSQDQMRRSREALAEAVRSGNQLAKSIRPSIPALPVPTVRIPPLTTPADRARLRARSHELADQVVATQRHLADRALEVTTPLAEQVIATQRHLADRALQVTTPLAEQVIATQRQLAGKALHAASPVVSDSVARLTHAVGTLPGMRRLGLADGVAAPEAVADREASPADGPVAEVRRLPTAASESALPRPRASKPRTPRASTTRAASATKAAGTSKAASTSKPRATKAAGTSKAASTSKPRATKAAGSTRTAGTRKPRSTKN
jgi:hypothetical protein